MSQGISFKSFLREQKELIDDYLSAQVERIPGPDILRDSMGYSLLSGGKRLRPILVLLGYEIAGGVPMEPVLPIAAAIEMIHTFSLIHDDLPAMDDDDVRRGKPTNHKVYGEGMAVLAGDALFAHAFRMIGSAPLRASVKTALLKEITEAVGTDGVIGGQAMDIFSEGKSPTEERVRYIHSRKTSSLIRTSLKCGGLAASAKPGVIRAYHEIGSRIGLAFQIMDDVLDETGTSEVMGKAVKKDLARGKCTYVRVYGLEKSVEHAQTLIGEVGSILKDEFPSGPADRLWDLSEFILERMS
jgi:geranylgeranyl diphosphate synthase type II